MTYIHTQPWAVYNEIDAYAADWLENLIAAGLIASGIVDRRSVVDVRPDDYRGFRQVHLFAGIGVWSYAFRRAGITDDTALWSLSCPCQPFSQTGKGSGVDDERHLWPHAHHLIRECRPAKIYGEQVASKDGLDWLDLVQTDMEGTGYAFGAVDTCSASVGAPHIRQRLRFTAYDLRSAAGRVDDGNDERLEGFSVRYQTEIGHGQKTSRSTSETGEFDGMADLYGFNGHRAGPSSVAECRQFKRSKSVLSIDNSVSNFAASPTNGFWRDADWLFCRDGRWRPVEPGSFPLAHGAPSRVGRLRAYGNAVDAEATREFIEATLEQETLDLVATGNLFDDVLG